MMEILFFTIVVLGVKANVKIHQAVHLNLFAHYYIQQLKIMHKKIKQAKTNRQKVTTESPVKIEELFFFFF